jgi:DNA-binding winged helix-turn-helix (wHTH) protein/tetratricopeptide (TPR) repeat protein
VPLEPIRDRSVIRFDQDFEIDLRVYELRHSGQVLKLERIPMEILLLLIDCRGRLVNRDEIADKIWGKGVALDTDNSINNAVRKIRVALNDDREQPRFIQTTTGRGYRFIGSIDENGQPSESTAGLLAQAPSASFSVSPNTPRQTGRIENTNSPKRRIWLGAAVLLIVFAVVFFLWKSSPEIASEKPATSPVLPLTEKDTIVLADFVNQTGDPVFDETLKQALSMELTQSPVLNVASDLQVRDVLRRMGRKPDEAVTGEVAAEVCSRAGGKAVIEGTVSLLGTEYVIGLQALGCANGATLGVAQAQVAEKDHVIKALSQDAAQIRGKIGESLPYLKKYNFPVDATTDSLEALKAFSMGALAERDRGTVEAIRFYQHATTLDPNFALAYATLGRAYEDEGEDAQAMQNFTRAFELRNRLSEREKYFVELLYNETVTGDRERAKEIGELWATTFPRDSAAHEKLGTVYGDLGEHEKSYEQARMALQIDPGSNVFVFNMAAGADTLNRHDESWHVLQSAQSQGLDGAELHLALYANAFQRGDQAEMERQIVWATGKPALEAPLLLAQSDSEAFHGRFRKARELSARAVALAKRDGETEIAAMCEVVGALEEIEIGNPSLANKRVNVALSLASTRDIKAQAALAWARSGNITRSRALLKELQSRNPSNTLLKFYWAPTIEASIDLRAANPNAAVSKLQVVTPYELSTAPPFADAVYLYPIYVRGEALLAAHNGRAAVAEFQKLLGHPGAADNSLVFALSRLQLGRAEAMTGDNLTARKDFQEFFSLWKDADPDIPVLIAAKSEYAKLK